MQIENDSESPGQPRYLVFFVEDNLELFCTRYKKNKVRETFHKKLRCPKWYVGPIPFLRELTTARREITKQLERLAPKWWGKIMILRDLIAHSYARARWVWKLFIILSNYETAPLKVIWVMLREAHNCDGVKILVVVVDIIICVIWHIFHHSVEASQSFGNIFHTTLKLLNNFLINPRLQKFNMIYSSRSKVKHVFMSFYINFHINFRLKFMSFLWFNLFFGCFNEWRWKIQFECTLVEKQKEAFSKCNRINYGKWTLRKISIERKKLHYYGRIMMNFLYKSSHPHHSITFAELSWRNLNWLSCIFNLKSLQFKVWC